MAEETRPDCPSCGHPRNIHPGNLAAARRAGRVQCYGWGPNGYGDKRPCRCTGYPIEADLAWALRLLAAEEAEITRAADSMRDAESRMKMRRARYDASYDYLEQLEASGMLPEGTVLPPRIGP